MFNHEMRKLALTKGFTLNEYSLRPINEEGVPGKPLDVNSEEDIFNYLDLEYKLPEERN